MSHSLWSLSFFPYSISSLYNIFKHSLSPFLLIFGSILGFSSGECAAQRQSINLSDQWQVRIGDNKYQAQLPGSLDTNCIGDKTTDFTQTTQLSRKYTYTGEAFYERTVEIPQSWEGQHIELFLERTRPTTVWIDGKEAGSVDYLSVPHVYDLTEFLTPGRHILTVMVDNGECIPEQIKSNSHACTEATQTNWNGIIGNMRLEAMSKTRVTDIQCYPLEDQAIKVAIAVENPLDGVPLKVTSTSINGNGEAASNRVNALASLTMSEGTNLYEVIFDLDQNTRWSHRNPIRQRVEVEIPGYDKTGVNTGLRSFTCDNHHFFVNDTLTFLRGKHDGCVWPLTGYTAMDVDQWRHYMQVCKDFGINHIRFHSWCPPEAAFEAADIEGIYLQPELTIWGTFNREYPTLMDFLHADGMEIMRRYGNHPSFAMFSLGNELWGEEDLMEEFVRDFRTVDSRHMYALGSNAYLGYKGTQPGEDFFVTCRVGEGDGYDGYSSHSRASFSFADAYDGGLLNHNYPSSTLTFEDAVSPSQKPIVGHETGQYQIYPNYDEIEKYIGVLYPGNFEVFRQRLADANMLSQAKDFFRASGIWSGKLYRADMEMNLRTPSMAGFQLLDLQDYPGQGSALIGVCDAFMDPKGVITPEDWRKSCDEIVVLGLLPKFCYTIGEDLVGEVAIANYSGNELRSKELLLSLVDQSGNQIYTKTLSVPKGQGYVPGESFTVTLPEFGEFGAAVAPYGDAVAPLSSDHKSSSPSYRTTSRNRNGAVSHSQSQTGSSDAVAPIGSTNENQTSDAVTPLCSVKDVKESKDKKQNKERLSHKASRKKSKDSRRSWRHHSDKSDLASSKAYKLTLTLELPEDNVTNDYDIWVYPQNERIDSKKVVIATTINDALEAIDKGKNVLLLPSQEEVDSATVGGLFQTDYWNYRMFKTISENNDKPVSPGTMGLLVNTEHPALEGYPTDIHTDWQWFTATKNGYPLILDALNPVDYRPVVQVIDNVKRNHRLGLVSEFKVGKSNVIVATIDYNALMEKPEGRQLVKSLVDYLNSNNIIKPTQPRAQSTTGCNKVELTKQELVNLLTLPTQSASIERLGNISYE